MCKTISVPNGEPRTEEAEQIGNFARTQTRQTATGARSHTHTHTQTQVPFLFLPLPFLLSCGAEEMASTRFPGF